MAAAFEGWVCLELLGHRVRYGHVTEVTLFGEPFARLEIPSDPPAVQLYSGKSIYAITPVTEEAVRAYHRPRQALAAAPLEIDRERFLDDDDDEPDERCGGCGKPIRFGEPTEQVTDENEDISTWHQECADSCDPENHKPADPAIDSDAPRDTPPPRVVDDDIREHG